MRVSYLLQQFLAAFRNAPGAAKGHLRNLGMFTRGFRFAETYRESWKDHPRQAVPPNSGPLWEYFQANTKGPGIWKWEHYFPVYERHFQHLRGLPVDVLEIGVYSGGSLGMWRDYFGPASRIHGVDIEPACRCYEREGVRIWIGDQADRRFWSDFRQKVPGIDVLIDDGGHTAEQQAVTLEEMLPHLRPGGVYLCEDICGIHHEFSAFAAGLVSDFNRKEAGNRTPFQAATHSIHFYPYLLVIEKSHSPNSSFDDPKRGTEWQPFFEKSDSIPPRRQ